MFYKVLVKLYWCSVSKPHSPGSGENFKPNEAAAIANLILLARAKVLLPLSLNNSKAMISDDGIKEVEGCQCVTHF